MVDELCLLQIGNDGNDCRISGASSGLCLNVSKDETKVCNPDCGKAEFCVLMWQKNYAYFVNIGGSFP